MVRRSSLNCPGSAPQPSGPGPSHGFFRSRSIHRTTSADAGREVAVLSCWDPPGDVPPARRRGLRATENAHEGQAGWSVVLPAGSARWLALTCDRAPKLPWLPSPRGQGFSPAAGAIHRATRLFSGSVSMRCGGVSGRTMVGGDVVAEPPLVPRLPAVRTTATPLLQRWQIGPGARADPSAGAWASIREGRGGCGFLAGR
jgi:hypothetical protein